MSGNALICEGTLEAGEQLSGQHRAGQLVDRPTLAPRL
jgi:hypothetical protein